MVNRLRGIAIVRPCPSCTNLIIYPVIITLFLYSEISFSSMRKYICCIHVVSQPSFLHLLSLSHSFPFSSLHLFPSLPPSLPAFLLHRSSPFTIDVYLLYADIETCQIGQCADIWQILFLKLSNSLSSRGICVMQLHILFQPVACAV